MARPKKEINWEAFKKLCAIFCTLEEIASILDVSEDTIQRRCKSDLGMTFSEAFKKYSANGKASLRRWQVKAAEKGNATMLIFLGKQYLGQSDQQTINIADDDETVVRMDEYFKNRASTDSSITL